MAWGYHIAVWEHEQCMPMQVARQIATAKFRAGKANVLVVTDVAARGLDIPLLDNVINFDFPAKPKLYVHRAGACHGPHFH